MPQRAETEPMTVRTARVSEIDALAAAMDRSRNYVVNQAIDQFLEANAWQVERIAAGVAAAREGNVSSADDVFGAIATKHGWQA
ncbi:hypothetical protein [uncultured Paracoccus sp.]|uniref:CopG family ribbon-helix-helix protein n=1 Tax=uncultured Paracoccus sp. TaxID=189685 RepID=UPI00262F7A2E|nr:hypothetical protein [uncultured Paracoccus sp.]